MRRYLLPLALACLLIPIAATGTEPPSLALPELATGRTMTLDSLRGEVVYLDFWASWCGPCRESLPLYEQMRQELPADGVRIVAVNLDESRADAERFLERYPVSYTVLLDPAGESAEQWEIKAMPSSFLLDAEGKVVRSWAGFRASHLEEIRNAILELAR
jgi:thiol-disulfide isomerase/thioredoxin